MLLLAAVVHAAVLQLDDTGEATAVSSASLNPMLNPTLPRAPGYTFAPASPLAGRAVSNAASVSVETVLPHESRTAPIRMTSGPLVRLDSDGHEADEVGAPAKAGDTVPAVTVATPASQASKWKSRVLAITMALPDGESAGKWKRRVLAVTATISIAALAAPGGLWLLPAAAAQGAGAVQSFSAFTADAAWAQALSLIFVSEIGDKTFFIAAILAARASRFLTFVGCGSALAFMTAASVAIGQIFHAVPDSFTRGLPLDDYVATAAFLFFGVRSLLDAAAVEDDGAGIQEEREDAEKTLAESDGVNASGWGLIREAFVLTTVAEIGDRSQIATIALSAAANPVAVFLGGTVGHLICTGMAVLGGAFISRYLSERAIGAVGGVLFIGFGVMTGLSLFS